MSRIRSTADIDIAVQRLHVAEPRFKAVSDRHGLPPLRLAEPGLASLLRIVTDQLISLKAGAAIWRRIEERLGIIAPTTVLACRVEDLKGLGLSTAKARSFLALARASTEGLLAPETLDPLSDEDAEAHLIRLPGIGPWTAQIYLLTALGRADAWPAGDLALQVSAASLFGLPARPGTADMTRLAEAWRPFRSVAARLLWCHYRDIKGLPQDPI